jgi:hypothetical protein
MKIFHIEKLDLIIDNPNQHNTEEKLSIVIRVVRDSAMQVREHYNSLGLLRDLIKTIQDTLEGLDSKLFGNKESEGTIYTLKAQVNMMKRSFDNFTKLLWVVLGTVAIDMIFRFFNII